MEDAGTKPQEDLKIKFKILRNNSETESFNASLYEANITELALKIYSMLMEGKLQKEMTFIALILRCVNCD